MKHIIVASHLAAAMVLVVFAVSANAAAQGLDEVTIARLAVNGSADTSNPGTTCLQLSSPPVAACTGGWIAIANNNKQLLAAALAAKSTSARLHVVYDDASATQHCPYSAFTPCTLSVLSVK